MVMGSHTKALRAHMRRQKYYKHPDKPGAGARKRRHAGAKDKVGIVMGEFKRGTLRSGGSGKRVTSRKQAIAIALSESRKRRPRKGEGG